jgi:hypothetical protein
MGRVWFWAWERKEKSSSLRNEVTYLYISHASAWLMHQWHNQWIHTLFGWGLSARPSICWERWGRGKTRHGRTQLLWPRSSWLGELVCAVETCMDRLSCMWAPRRLGIFSSRSKISLVLEIARVTSFRVRNLASIGCFNKSLWAHPTWDAWRD